MKRVGTALLILSLVFISGCVGETTGAFLQGQEGCFPMWQCDQWSGCVLTDDSWAKTRTCFDVNNCGDEMGKPTETESCEPFSDFEIEIGKRISQCGIVVELESVEIDKYVEYGDSNKNMTLLLEEYFIVPYIKIENNFRHSIETKFKNFILEDENGKEYKARCPNETTQVVDDCQLGDDWHLGSKYTEPATTREGNLIFVVPNIDGQFKLFYEMPDNTYDCKTPERIYWIIK